MKFAIALFLLCLTMSTQAADTRFLQSLHNANYFHLASPELERGFHVYVMLPESYDPDKSYPSIYALDGGNAFPLMASVQRLLRFTEEVPEVILVGISYGSDTFEGGNYRSTDFTAPSSEREYWGGAEAFQRFLRTQLIPEIEERYSVRPDRRVIFGHSLGGQFVLFTAQTEPALFWGHIASNPALHRNLPFFLETVPKRAGEASVFVASGTEDAPRFRKPALQWIQHWQSMQDRPFALEVAHLDRHTHMSTPPEAYRLGMRFLFGID